MFFDKNSGEIKNLIDQALLYSGHKLKTKSLLSILTSGARFKNDESFKQLNPVFEIDSRGIEMSMKERFQSIYL